MHTPYLKQKLLVINALYKSSSKLYLLRENFYYHVSNSSDKFEKKLQ